jgi:hypothetical protein
MSELTITEDPFVKSALREAEPGVDIPMAFETDSGLMVREARSQPIEWVDEDGVTVRASSNQN